MTKSIRESREYARGLARYVRERPPAGVQPFVIPSFTSLHVVAGELGDDSPVLLGAQNTHWADAGAWTGEISPLQLKDAGAQMVEIGHSERRQHFGETIEMTNLKVAAALRHGLIPLLCVGEDAKARAGQRVSEVLLRQAEGALVGLNEEELSRVLIAYEPVWAIGDQGRPARPDELVGPFEDLHSIYGDRVQALLYGGSVNLGNAVEIARTTHVGGLFVGRAAWDLDGYIRLLELMCSELRN